MRWANIQAIDVKFPQDLTHKKSLKSFNFWQNYLKNKKVDVFLGHSVVCFWIFQFSYFNHIFNVGVTATCIVGLYVSVTFYHAACNATHGIAVAVLSICLSVRCMYCDKTKWCTADILIPHETAMTLVFWHQHWLVGNAPFPVKYSVFLH